MMYVLWALGILVGVGVLAFVALYLYGKLIPVAGVVAVEVDLKRSQQQVYDLIADLPGHTRWAPQVKSVTPIEAHEGRPAYVMMVDRQKFNIYTSRDDRPRAFAVTVFGNKMCQSTWTWEITPTPTGCTVRLTEDGDIYIAVFRALVRVLGMQAKYLVQNLSGLAGHFGEPAQPRRVV